MSRGRVLLLDGQTTQALACVRSLGRAGFEVLVASDARIPLAGWSRFSRQVIRHGGETLSGFAELRAQAVALGVTCILPLTERSCTLCNMDRRAWEEAGITVGCGRAEMLERAFDKVRTLEFARDCGVTAPETRIPASLADVEEAGRAVGYPCVVKSRFSHAWDGEAFLPAQPPRYVADAQALEAAASALRQGPYWPLIQAYVPGTGRGVFALCDRGRVLSWFAHERLRDVRPSGSGSSLRRSIEVPPHLLELSRRMLAAMEWHGPAMLEFRDGGEGGPWLMEVNGRFWGSLQLAVESGADFPRWWAEVLAGDEPRISGYTAGVTVRWTWGDVKHLLYALAGPPAGYPGRYPTRPAALRAVLGAQPPGTRSETWAPDDRWPAVGEWMQGITDLLARGKPEPHRAAATSGVRLQPLAANAGGGAPPDAMMPTTPRDLTRTS